MSRVRAQSVLLSLAAAVFAVRPAEAQDTKKEAKKPAKKDATPFTPAESDIAEIKAHAAKLAKALADLKKPVARDPDGDLLADAAVHLKAAEWIVRHGEFYNKGLIAQTNKVIDRGLDRVAQLAAGKRPWAEAKGGIARGYVSRVDGSLQPYAVIVPADYTGADRMRLDVVLHGRNGTITEAGFLAGFDGKPAPAGNKWLELHVFGRTNNAYRWAGEADVFEAIAAVKRNYRVDENRVVLRGFSMGGAGAWHLGLHHPGVWCSVEAGAGFTETRKYAKLDNPPDYIAKGLHIYDAMDYSLNAWNLPVAGYGGENDPQQQASLNIRAALASLGVPLKTDGLVTTAENIDFRQIVGAKVEHKVDPVSAKLLKDFHDDRAGKGRNQHPKHIRFVTYTLKWNDCHWLTVEALQEHYVRATVDAEIKDGVIHIKADNVAVLSVDRGTAEKVSFGPDQEFALSGAADDLLPNVYFRNAGGKWSLMNYKASREFQSNPNNRKRHNLQGPIDDAFTGPFLCVRGTGTPWHPAVQKWADARLTRFAADWNKWMRGELPIKNDTDLTAEDIETHNIVLFGDPGSNSVLARMLGHLPVTWTKDDLNLGGGFSSADHAPVLICPNPENGKRYVVVNSGHTFGAKDFAGTNALLYPRLGDYGVIKIGATGDEVKLSGYFDEGWKFK